MEKPADAAYPIHDLLRRRWSPRAYSERPVEREKLQSLSEAARWAPSSGQMGALVEQRAALALHRRDKSRSSWVRQAL